MLGSNLTAAVEKENKQWRDGATGLGEVGQVMGRTLCLRQKTSSTSCKS
jgi:hypothetical protein